MKKTKNLIASLLCLVFATSVIASVVSKIKVHADEVDLTKSYLELTTTELDNLSRRTNTSTTNPQITVFTHGWSSTPYHWSNDINGDGDYVFAYQAGSMIDKLLL